MTRVDWKSFFCNVNCNPVVLLLRRSDLKYFFPYQRYVVELTIAFSASMRSEKSSNLLFDPVSSLVSWFLPLFSVSFAKLSDLFESQSKLALEMWILWNLSWLSSFSNEDFSAKVCQAFPIWLQTRACQASFGQFYRQAGPLFAGAPAHAAMCLACDTYVALPLHWACAC